MGVKR